MRPPFFESTEVSHRLLMYCEMQYIYLFNTFESYEPYIKLYYECTSNFT